MSINNKYNFWNIFMIFQLILILFISNSFHSSFQQHFKLLLSKLVEYMKLDQSELNLKCLHYIKQLETANLDEFQSFELHRWIHRGANLTAQ